MALRNNLTPFLKAVTKALSSEVEHEEDFKEEKREALFNEILQNIPAENSSSNFYTYLSRASDTLKLEFDQLLDRE